MEGMLDWHNEEFYFENTFSSSVLVLSALAKRDDLADDILQCSGSVAIPLSRLEEDIPVSDTLVYINVNM